MPHDRFHRSVDLASCSRRLSPSSHSRSHHVDRKRKRSHSRSRAYVAPVLPLRASSLSKHDFTTYKPMFAQYLEIQKQLKIEDISETEVRGRWKSFVGKWNRGELAEGWYDRATLQKAIDSSASLSALPTAPKTGRILQDIGGRTNSHGDPSSDEDGPGPALPSQHGPDVSRNHRSGPAIPNLQDLELRRELVAEDLASAREVLRHRHALERKQEKERLEELAPRAEAGSKERMLEKKREKAATNRAFASTKTEGDVPEVPESDLLGDEDGGIEGFKKQKQKMERKKNEREIRREEVLRARALEREEKVKQYREKKASTMKGLIELAKARFG